MLRWFTPEEVNEQIPRLERILAELIRRAAEIRTAVLHVAEVRGCKPEELGREQLLALAPELRGALETMGRLLFEIERSGGIFRGIELGLVDFPARIDGEEVYLCWQYGEPEVAFYHRPEDGFAGRKPLPRGRGRVPPLQ